ncbi:hypothetical protein [Mycobacterium sp.]|uniref:hypothetical protein n=1 Tax=Mycobacterium sp. TaxID=1785 RepID=UPI0025DFDE2F|nr:hypothetical protein [Mycobacterium sp.]MBW0013929.1 hypothetical protein [Mycobacterium sp.]
MRFIHVAAAVGLSAAASLITPVVLAGAPSAQADQSGYSRCVGNIAQLPLNEPDPKSIQLARQIEQDLKSGVSPAAETQKVMQLGFDSHAAAVVVQCAQQENP